MVPFNPSKIAPFHFLIRFEFDKWEILLKKATGAYSFSAVAVAFQMERGCLC